MLHLLPVGTNKNVEKAVCILHQVNVSQNINSYIVEGGELGRWCELGQHFSDSSPLLLLVKGHWCAMGRKFSAL